MGSRSPVALWCDETGQDLIEYTLLMGFIALVSVAILTGIQVNFTTLWNGVSDAIVDAMTAG